jgi:hypothetical protein
MSEVKCSTCKGEKTLTFEQGQRCVPCVTCSGSGTDWRKTYDAALTQLAALREELAGLQDSCAIDRRHLDRMIDHGDDLQQRLADAERRNAVLVNLLRETCGHYSVLTGIILTLSREDQLTSEPMRKSAYAACDHGKKINAALNKPEEAKS